MENYVSEDFLTSHQEDLRMFFTDLHLAILKKRAQQKPLDSNERTYYYKFIKPRLQALLTFSGKTHIHGHECILPGRTREAESLIKLLSQKHKHKKILISGSFLFSKNYTDIDAFIFTTYTKEDYRKGKIHVNFLKESALDSLFFRSLSQISVSNFLFIRKTDFDISLGEILQDYELLINHIINKDPYTKELRDFLVKTEYLGKKVILDPKQLHQIVKHVQKPNILRIISEMLINALILGYDTTRLRKRIQLSMTHYENLQIEYPATNISEYLTCYSRVMELAT